jgi:hypothetical protein
MAVTQQMADSRQQTADSRRHTRGGGTFRSIDERHLSYLDLVSVSKAATLAQSLRCKIWGSDVAVV